jgi:hypothetical protein
MEKSLSLFLSWPNPAQLLSSLSCLPRGAADNDLMRPSPPHRLIPYLRSGKELPGSALAVDPGERKHAAAEAPPGG